MFYDNFERICNERHMKPSRVCIEAGLDANRASNWKGKDTIPKQKELDALAAVLNCDVADFFSTDRRRYTLTPVPDTEQFGAPETEEEQKLMELLREDYANMGVSGSQLEEAVNQAMSIMRQGKELQNARRSKLDILASLAESEGKVQSTKAADNLSGLSDDERYVVQLIRNMDRRERAQFMIEVYDFMEKNAILDPDPAGSNKNWADL